MLRIDFLMQLLRIKITLYKIKEGEHKTYHKEGHHKEGHHKEGHLKEGHLKAYHKEGHHKTYHKENLKRTLSERRIIRLKRKIICISWCFIQITMNTNKFSF